MTYSRTNEHHYFDYQMWQDEAAAGDTQRGYADWVEAQIEQTEDELDDAEPRFEGAGRRDIELADEIDALRARLDPDSPYHHLGRSPNESEGACGYDSNGYDRRS